MNLTVSYFGQLATVADKDSELVDAADGAHLVDLMGKLCERHGDEFRSFVLDDGGTLRPSLLITVNGRSVDRANPPSLSDGDEIALLPPIAGG